MCSVTCVYVCDFPVFGQMKEPGVGPNIENGDCPKSVFYSFMSHFLPKWQYVKRQLFSPRLCLLHLLKHVQLGLRFSSFWLVQELNPGSPSP